MTMITIEENDILEMNVDDKYGEIKPYIVTKVQFRAQGSHAPNNSHWIQVRSVEEEDVPFIELKWQKGDVRFYRYNKPDENSPRCDDCSHFQALHIGAKDKIIKKGSYLSTCRNENCVCKRVFHG